jgi:hypothetical protein
MNLVVKSLVPLSFLVTLLAWAPDCSTQLKKFFDPQKVVTLQGQIEKMHTITRQGRQAQNSQVTP